MKVITIGGLTGGGGRIIGPLIARKLRYEYVDREIMTKIAEVLNVDVDSVRKVDEGEKIGGSGFLERLKNIFEKTAFYGGDPLYGSNIFGYLTQEYEDVKEMIYEREGVAKEAYFEKLSEVVNELSQIGNVVIVGRGASIILKDDEDTLKIGMVADKSERINRISQRYKIDSEKAELIIDERDKARQLNFKDMFGVDDPDSPNIYDVVINTSKVSIKDSVRTVLNLVELKTSFSGDSE